MLQFYIPLVLVVAHTHKFHVASQLCAIYTSHVHAVAGVEAGQWWESRPVGSIRSKTAHACTRANFSHIHFYTNFAAKIIANRLETS